MTKDWAPWLKEGWPTLLSIKRLISSNASSWQVRSYWYESQQGYSKLNTDINLQQHIKLIYQDDKVDFLCQCWTLLIFLFALVNPLTLINQKSIYTPLFHFILVISLLQTAARPSTLTPCLLRIHIQLKPTSLVMLWLFVCSCFSNKVKYIVLQEITMAGIFVPALCVFTDTAWPAFTTLRGGQ